MDVESFLKRNSDILKFEENGVIMKFLFVKMFAGRYNNRSIGHEVINLYQHDNYNKDDYSYLYIPPYGSYGRQDSSFIESTDYKEINTIFFFEQERGYISRLVAIARNVEIIKSSEELVNLPKTIKFSNVPIKDINFTLSEDDDSNQNIFGVTYKVKKSNYYDAREKNLLFYPQNKQKEATETLNDKYPYSYFQTKLANSWHIYTNKSTPDFDKWWKENEEKICISDNIMIPENLNYDFKNYYNPENFLYFIDKEDDENIVTNMFFYFLNKYDSFRNSFTKFLLKSINKEISLNNCQIIVKKQKVAITEEQKRKNQFLRSKNSENKQAIIDDLVQNYSVPEEWFDKENEVFKPGYIDLYLEGDSFRIVVENKIKSGLNGLFYKHELH